MTTTTGGNGLPTTIATKPVAKSTQARIGAGVTLLGLIQFIPQVVDLIHAYQKSAPASWQPVLTGAAMILTGIGLVWSRWNDKVAAQENAVVAATVAADVTRAVAPNQITTGPVS